MYQPEPIFKKGQLLKVQGATCEIQAIEQSKWQTRYAVHNHYNAYGSGWISEDDLISKLDKECPTCFGGGKIDVDEDMRTVDCWTCGGSGRVSK